MDKKLIIFDFDGPINNLTEAKIAATKTLSRTLNLQLSNEAAWNLVNYIDQIYENQKIIQYEKIIEIALSKLKDQGLTSVSREQLKHFSSRFENELKKNIIFDTDLIKLIKSLKNEKPYFKVCIYSSQTKKNINSLLKLVGIKKECFDKIYGRESFTEPKPSMENLEKICKDLGVKLSNSIMIGDNVTVDLSPASTKV